MRKLITILFFAASLHCQATRIIVAKQGSWGAFYSGNSSLGCSAGDTLVIRESDGWGGAGCSFQSLRGDSLHWIVIINESGGAYTNIGAILIRGCHYVKVTGSGTSGYLGYYGFVSDGNLFNPAFSVVDVDGQSKYVEVERIYGKNIGYGIRAKQDGSCSDSLNYPNWHMNHIYLHDNQFINTNQDVIYAGNTAPTEGRPVGCPGGTINPIPMRMSDVYIYNNIIDSAGRTGIQLSGCDSGSNYIYGNSVRRTGYEYNNTQGSGIILGGCTKNTQVFNNTVDSTFQYGILSLGSFGNEIRNNNVNHTAMIPIRDGGNTSTNSTPLNKIISAGGNITDLVLKIDGTKVSGTVGGSAYILAAPDTSGGVNGGVIIYTALSDTFAITNVSSQSKTWTLSGFSKRWFKLVVVGTGTQVSTWTESILNPGYDFSIACNALQTYPAGDSASIIIRDNVCDNSDASNVITGTSVDLWKRSGNYICTNTTQAGGAASVNINGANFNYSTDCSGLGGAISGARYNYLRLKRGVRIKIRQ